MKTHYKITISKFLHYRDLVLRMEQGHEDTMMGSHPGDRVLHDDAVPNVHWTFVVDGNANLLSLVSLRDFSSLVYILYL